VVLILFFLYNFSFYYSIAMELIKLSKLYILNKGMKIYYFDEYGKYRKIIKEKIFINIDKEDYEQMDFSML